MRTRKKKSVTEPTLDHLVSVPSEGGGSPAKKKNPFLRFLHWLFPWKGDSVKLILLKSFFLVCVVGFCISAYVLCNYYFNNLIADNEYSSALNLISSSSSQASSDSASSASENLLPLPAGYQERFNALYQANQQLRGWVKIDGTNIDYPVAQGSDNNYYLTHTFFNSGSSVGSVFMDYRCKFGPDAMPGNTILYGHNMQSGKMFHDIQNYKNVSYYKQHPFVQYDTVYADSNWKIIGMFFTNADFSQPDTFPYHMTFDFNDDTSFYNYVNQAMQRSFFTTSVDVKPSDKLLVLSTCDNAFENSRLVLIARQVREGESNAVDVNAAVQNASQYLPQNYIDKFGGTFHDLDGEYRYYSPQ